MLELKCRVILTYRRLILIETDNIVYLITLVIIGRKLCLWYSSDSMETFKIRDLANTLISIIDNPHIINQITTNKSLHSNRVILHQSMK